MKLHNKKTGGNGEYKVISAGYLIRVKDCNSDEAWQYDCLAGFNEDWEDYKPAEPYIEDEKIRKFVRDWADMNGISKIIVFDESNSPYIPAGQVVFAENAGRLRICFKTGEKFDTDRIYSVPELCGEEKE